MDVIETWRKSRCQIIERCLLVAGRKANDRCFKQSN